MTQKPLTNLKISELTQAKLDSEAQVLTLFEKFFLFEFYVRYLKRSRNQELTQLLTLKDSIKQRFIELKMVDILALYTYSFEENSELRYPLDITLEELTRWTLDALQLSYCQLSRLCSEIVYVELSQEDLGRLITPFKELKDSIKPDLKLLYYRFSDLTNPNDIPYVLNWWTQHLDEIFRRNEKLLGKVGLTCVRPDTWDDINADQDVLCHSLPEFSAPEIILFKRINYDLYNSDETEVKINGQQLANSVVLSIPFDQEAENIAEIIRDLLSTFYGKQNEWLFDKTNSRSDPVYLFNQNSESMSSFLKASSHNYHLVKKDTSISKYLSGLICYDAYVQEQEKQSRKKQQPAEEPQPKKNRRKPSEEENVNKGLEKIAEKILNGNPSITLTDANSLMKNYDKVRKEILGINKIFIKTFPTEKSRFQNNTIL